MRTLNSVYKDKQFLVFDFEDHKSVKYDFATKKAYGLSGKEVKNLNTQLTGITMQNIIDKCKDQNYARYLRYCRDCESYDYCISNIGTILSRVPRYSNYEQLFSAGIYNVERHFGYKLNEIPKALVKVSKTKNIRITERLVEYWKCHPNEYNLAFNLDYISLTTNDVYQILTSYRWINGEYVSTIDIMLKYGYTMKPLMIYLDTPKTFEALDDISAIFVELYDYARMMRTISGKFDKYPRNFLTTHKIASRNYDRFKKEFNEDLFAKTFNHNMECKIDNYVFICPKVTQDIKDEAVAMNNCVASYIDDVINGCCNILFMRNADKPDESLVTLEVVNGKIVQAKRRYNTDVTSADRDAICKWEERYKKFLVE